MTVKHGVYALFSYMNEFKTKTVKSIGEDYPNLIIDFCGGAQIFRLLENRGK